VQREQNQADNKANSRRAMSDVRQRKKQRNIYLQTSARPHGEIQKVHRVRV